MARLAEQVKAALEAADLAAFGDLLDPAVTWGPANTIPAPCRNREQVLAWYRRGRESGVRARVFEVVVVGKRIVVGMSVARELKPSEAGGVAERWQVLTVEAGRIVDIVGFDQRDEALAAATVIAAGEG